MDDTSTNPTNSTSSNNTMYLVIGAVVVVLLLGVVGFAFKDQILGMMGVPVQPAAEETSVPTPAPQITVEPAAPAPEAMTAEEVVVTFDGKTFTPSSVTVKKGGTVKFVNGGSVYMEVASAPHPTHTAYPEFDQSKDAAQKDKTEYVFTFERVGKWSYHNHSPLVQGAFGTVEVTE